MILNRKAAVAISHGCKSRLIGSMSKKYCVNGNPVIYKIHSFLEEYRTGAERNCVNGPITLITGPTDVGKSTLCRSLLNYTANEGRTPLFIDLDVGQSSLSIPGTVSILPINKPQDMLEGFDESELSVYYFGYKAPAFNMLLYYLLLNKLGESIHLRMRNSKQISISGVLIDTCGWVIGQGYEAILVAAHSFRVNTVIVLSDKELFSNLKSDLPSNVEIKFVSKLEGVVTRNKFTRCKNRDSLIQEYFYGSKFSLKPYSFQVKFSDIKIFQASTTQIKVNLDKLNDARQYISVVPVDISLGLINQVLALSYVNDIEKEDFLLTSVLGFILVQHVDMDSELITVLSPQPSPLPKRILIKGDIQVEIKNI